MYNGSIINPSPTIIAPVGAEITGSPFTAVAFDSNGALVTAKKGSVPVGILVAEEDEIIPAGEEVTVQIKDISVWKVGATVAAGAPLAPDNEGLAVTAAAGDFILGVALESADAKGQVIKVQITKSGYSK